MENTCETDQTDHPECKSRPDSGLSVITELDPGVITEFKQKNTKRKSDSSKAKEAKKSKTDEPATENGEANENGNEDENEVEENGVADTE